MRLFNEMRKRMILNAQIMIAYHWRRFVKRRAQMKISEKLLANEARRDAKNAKTDGGKKILVQKIVFDKDKEKGGESPAPKGTSSPDKTAG